MEVGWLAGPSLFTLLLCQVMRLWRCASETGWRWVGAARVPAVWGGGVNCYFLLKLDFIFVHSETSTLSWNTVLALNFHPTMQELGVMYRCVPEMEKTVSDGIKKERGQGYGERLRQWDTGEESEMEGWHGGSTHISAFPVHSGKCHELDL